MPKSANSNQGAAYVFFARPAWVSTNSPTAKLTASDGAANDQFGTSVSISGNTAVVGPGLCGRRQPRPGRGLCVHGTRFGLAEHE